MTIQAALERADLTRQNQLDGALKLAWLSELDGRLHTELFSAFDPAPEPFSGYDEDTDPDTALAVGHPYDGLYVQYLVMRIDLENGELARYNADAACFNRAWQSFAGHYARTHRPRGVGRLRF